MHTHWLSLPLTALWLAACGGTLTREEAKESLEEAQVASQSQALTSSGIEVGTNFTIGDAFDAAADELRTFIESQLPCADVTVEAGAKMATLTIEYGAKSGNCTYRGNTFQGTHQILIAKNEKQQVLVDHTWTGFSNGKVTVDGSATVEWDFEQKFRHATYDTRWTRERDGRTGEGTGDVTQEPLAGGLGEGFSVAGSRDWEGNKGAWALSIDDVEMRWVDPVPQAGRYQLDTPFDKRVTLSFDRVSSKSIQVTIAGPRKSFQFDVATPPANDG
jgi:hypothetical protein